MKFRKVVGETLFVTMLMLVVYSPALLLAQEPGPAGARPQAANTTGVDLVAMLRATPGCIGVETARTGSGKQVLFAWFENKAAVLAWVNSEAHQRLISTLAPGGHTGRTPLASIPDESGPILTIASLTYASESQVQGVALPISQIAIELYAPLPGGLAVGGRFAPSTLKVPELLEAPGK